MLLPNAARAVVDPPKIRDYLLSHQHPDGRAKAVADLLAIATSAQAIVAGRSRHGRKYLVTAKLRGPAGRDLFLMTVWIVRWGEDFPRFVTAYPGVRR